MTCMKQTNFESAQRDAKASGELDLFKELLKDADKLHHFLQAWEAGELVDGVTCEDEVADTVEGCRRTTTASKRDTIESIGWPTVLILTLKRFHYNPANSLYDKISAAVKFPFVWAPRAHMSYTLYAVLAHHGHFVNVANMDQTRGHYTAYARDTQHQWYMCDIRWLMPFIRFS